MSFRVFSAGLVFVTVFQVLVATGVVLFMVHCEAPERVVRPGETETMGRFRLHESRGDDRPRRSAPGRPCTTCTCVVQAPRQPRVRDDAAAQMRREA